MAPPRAWRQAVESFSPERWEEGCELSPLLAPTTAAQVRALLRRLMAPVEVVAGGGIAVSLLLEPQVAVRSKCGQAAHEAAIGFAPCHAISHLPPAVSPQPQELRKCGSFLFSVRLAQSSIEISTNKFAQEKDRCHVLSTLAKNPVGSRVGSGQQIIAAASRDCPPNKLANGSLFRQDDTRINIRGIGFTPCDMRLIH